MLCWVAIIKPFINIHIVQNNLPGDLCEFLLYFPLSR